MQFVRRCYGLCGIYGRFDSRFYSNAEKRFARPYSYRLASRSVFELVKEKWKKLKKTIVSIIKNATGDLINDVVAKLEELGCDSIDDCLLIRSFGPIDGYISEVQDRR